MKKQNNNNLNYWLLFLLFLFSINFTSCSKKQDVVKEDNAPTNEKPAPKDDDDNDDNNNGGGNNGGGNNDNDTPILVINQKLTFSNRTNALWVDFEVILNPFKANDAKPYQATIEYESEPNSGVNIRDWNATYNIEGNVLTIYGSFDKEDYREFKFDILSSTQLREQSSGIVINKK